MSKSANHLPPDTPITVEMAIEEAFSKLNKEDEFKQPGQDLAIETLGELLSKCEAASFCHYLVSLRIYSSSGDWMNYSLDVTLQLIYEEKHFALAYSVQSIFETRMWELGTTEVNVCDGWCDERWLIGDQAMNHLKQQIKDVIGT